MIVLLAYAATVGVLGAYAVANHLGRPVIFDAANAICSIPLVVANITVDAIWGAVISGTFGIIGAISLIRHYQKEAHSCDMSS